MASITNSNVLTLGAQTLTFSTGGTITANGNIDVADDVRIANASLSTASGNTITLTTTDTASVNSFTMPSTAPQIGQMLACSTGGVLSWNDEQTIQLPIVTELTNSTLDAGARLQIGTPTIDRNNSELSISGNIITFGVGIWEITCNIGLAGGVVNTSNGEFFNAYDVDTSSNLTPVMQFWVPANNADNAAASMVHQIIEVTSGTRNIQLMMSRQFDYDVECTIVLRKLK